MKTQHKIIPLGKRDFNDLVEHFTINAHCQLLENGGKGLKSAIFAAMQTAINWNIIRSNKK